MVSITTKDGYRITVYSAGYLDWGLRIEQKLGGHRSTVYECPCALDHQTVGGDDFEGKNRNRWRPWSKRQWREYLRLMADSMVETFVEDANYV